MKKRYKIELSDEAENDFDESFEFYMSKSEKLADKFYGTIDDSLNKIAQNPKASTKFHKDTRKHVVPSFPFVIYYQIKQIVVRVIAIFHTSRNPDKLQDRG